MQLEISLQTVIYASNLANKSGIKVILNPAPACQLPFELFKGLFCITPNKTEAEMLSGIKITSTESVEKACQIIYEKGVANVIVTLGHKGAFLYNEHEKKLLEAPYVDALDTTAAGDVFNGALAVALSEEKTLEESIFFANKAASVCVTRMGAQSSIPYWYEIK